MKKIAGIFGVIFLSAVSSYAQTWNWAEQGTSPLVSTYFAGEVTAITIDSSRNVFIGGYFYDSLYFGATILYSRMNDFVYPTSFLTKYDSAGKLLWAKQSKISYSSSTFVGNAAVAYGVAADKFGNVYETGNFWDSATFGSYQLVNPIESEEAFLVKYSPGGNVLWAKQSIGTNIGDASATSVTTDNAGNIYVTGTFLDTIKFGSFSVLSIRTKGSYPFFLVKYDSTGNVLWAKQSLNSSYGASASNTSNISMDAKGNIYMTGLFIDTIIWPPYILHTPSKSKQSAFVAKFDNNGNALWAKQIDGDSIELWHCALTTDALGNTYIATVFKDNITFGAYHFYAPKSGILFAKCNTKGSILWAKYFNGINGWFNCLSVDARGHIYLSAEMGDTLVLFGADTLKMNYIVGGEAIVKFDTAGNVMCSSAIPSAASYGGVVAEPKGTGAFIGGSVWRNISLGAYSIGPPITTVDYRWPFAAKWTGCKDDDFYTYGSTKSPCKWQCNGAAKAIPSDGVAPFTYTWNTKPAQTSQTAAGLCAGNYIVTVTDSLGNKASQLLTVPKPVENLKISAVKDSICTGKNILFSASGASSYTWFPAAGLSCSTCPNPLATPSVTTTYKITGTDTLGCKDTSYIKLNVLPLPTISSGSDICKGNSFTINATGGSGYVWNTGETTNGITVSPSAATTYSVLVNVYNACTDTLYGKVIVRQTPVVSLCCDSVITTGESVQLIAAGGNSYLWQPATGLNCNTCSSPVATPMQTTIYTVIVTNDSGCSTSRFVTIDVNCNIFIPNAFSPNGDGQNDYLYVRGKCIKEMDFIIYDRWGNKVFETNDQNIPWDGTYKGQTMNMGTYVYYLSAITIDGQQVVKKGNVALVR